MSPVTDLPPEVLGLIFGNLRGDMLDEASSLRSAIRVCRQWYFVGIQPLWRNATSRRLSRVPTDRTNIYAPYIRCMDFNQFEIYDRLLPPETLSVRRLNVNGYTVRHFPCLQPFMREALRHIGLSDGKLEPPLIAHLATYCKELRSITIINCDLAALDGWLRVLNTFRLLEEATVIGRAGCNTVLILMKQLAMLPNLKHLHFHASVDNPALGKLLKNRYAFPALESLSISTPAKIMPSLYLRIPHLKKLSLSADGAPGRRLFSKISQLTELRDLSMELNPRTFSRDGIMQLIALAKLQSLEVTSAEDASLGFSHEDFDKFFAHFKYLRRCIFKKVHDSAAALPYIGAHCIRIATVELLQPLKLCNMQALVSRKGAPLFPRLKQLRALSFSSDRGLESLTHQDKRDVRRVVLAISYHMRRLETLDCTTTSGVGTNDDYTARIVAKWKKRQERKKQGLKRKRSC